MTAQSEERAPLALVTGASGFIGSELVRELGSRGTRVRALLRRSSSIANLEGCAYERVDGDLTDETSLADAVRGVDVVYHLAGVVAAPERQGYFAGNRETTAALARACARESETRGRDLTFVFVSSLAAGGPSLRADRPRREEDPDRPVSAYGESKLAAEEALVACAGPRVRIIMLRPPAVYGPRDRGLYEFIRLAARGILVSYPASAPGASKTYSLIHVRDLVHAIRLAGERVQGARVERCYVAGEGFWDWERVMREVARQMGRPRVLALRLPRWAWAGLAWTYAAIGKATGRVFPLNPDKLAELDADVWTCDGAKARQLLGFAPVIALEDGLTETLRWYAAKGWISGSINNTLCELTK